MGQYNYEDNGEGQRNEQFYASYKNEQYNENLTRQFVVRQKKEIK